LEIRFHKRKASFLVINKTITRTGMHGIKFGLDGEKFGAVP